MKIFSFRSCENFPFLVNRQMAAIPIELFPLIRAQHPGNGVCMCDLDEEKVNQLFTEYLSAQPIVDKVAMVYNLQEGEKGSYGIIEDIDHPLGDCSVECVMNQTFYCIVRRFKKLLQENDAITMSKINVTKRTKNQRRIWVLDYWYKPHKFNDN